MPSPSASELSGSRLLAALPDDALRAVAPRFTIRNHPKNAILVSEGERMDVFNIVLDGRVKFFWRDDGGRQVDVAIVGRGEDFAAQAFGGEPMLHTIIALEAVRLATLPIGEFEQLLLAHPTLALAYVKRVVGLFRRATAGRRSLAMEDVYGRVTELLLASAAGSSEPPVTEKFTQAEIGQRVGATREMVGRILRDLARGGYIAVDRGRFTLLRPFPRRW